jgi:hypothetical protein
MTLDSTAYFVNVQASTGFRSTSYGGTRPTARTQRTTRTWRSSASPASRPTRSPSHERREETTATNENTAGKTYSLVLGITAKMISDIAAQTANGITVYNEVVSRSGTTFTLAHTPIASTIRLYAAGGNSNPQEGRLLPGAGNDFTQKWSGDYDAQQDLYCEDGSSRSIAPNGEKE